eukprot:1377647-Pleurochrysis_carterae.AAC.1
MSCRRRAFTRTLRTETYSFAGTRAPLVSASHQCASALRQVFPRPLCLHSFLAVVGRRASRLSAEASPAPFTVSACAARGVEVRHALRPVRHADNHTGTPPLQPTHSHVLSPALSLASTLPLVCSLRSRTLRPHLNIRTARANTHASRTLLARFRVTLTETILRASLPIEVCGLMQRYRICSTGRTHALPRIVCAQAVIFCNTKKKVDWLTNKMRQANFTVSSMHGDMPQK